ncbi:hypothetical protein [Sphingomonas sp. PvP055]|uniref:hypothetical protein n=1 Tax=Sphingomonas sp. PvP055 TaxID=3156391 RepID=UPI0033934379
MSILDHLLPRCGGLTKFGDTRLVGFATGVQTCIVVGVHLREAVLEGVSVRLQCSIFQARNVALIANDSEFCAQLFRIACAVLGAGKIGDCTTKVGVACCCICAGGGKRATAEHPSKS